MTFGASLGRAGISKCSWARSHGPERIRRNKGEGMKSLIVCVSVSHANTKKVARAMAEILDASVVEPEEVDLATIGDYDLVGFGSGIYFMAFHTRLRHLVRGLPDTTNQKAFVFSTSGSREPSRWRYTRRLQDQLVAKGYDVLGSFSCRGFDSWLPLRLLGGINKGKPDAADLERARDFAANPHQSNGATDHVARSPKVQAETRRQIRRQDTPRRLSALNSEQFRPSFAARVLCPDLGTGVGSLEGQHPQPRKTGRRFGGVCGRQLMWLWNRESLSARA